MFMQEKTYPEGTRVLVWHLDEDAQHLLALCQEGGIAIDDLLGLPEKRQREKAAERLLLYHAMGCPVTLSHDRQGAPSLQGITMNVSITHTPRLVAVALNEQQDIGLDAEQMDRRQVLRVRDKFLNDREKQFIAVDDLSAHVLAWTAKEAIIKAERDSSLDWTDGITLEPFVVNTPWPDEISLAASCRGHRYCLSARRVDDHVMTVAVAPVD